MTPMTFFDDRTNELGSKLLRVLQINSGLIDFLKINLTHVPSLFTSH